MKQRNQQHPLSAMLPGDRFYFAGKKKDIHTLDSKEPFFSKLQAGFTVHYANCIPDSDPLKQPVPHKIFYNGAPNRVIFLRNINDKI